MQKYCGGLFFGIYYAYLLLNTGLFLGTKLFFLFHYSETDETNTMTTFNKSEIKLSAESP